MRLRSKIKNKILLTLLSFCKKLQKKPTSFNASSPRILLISTTALGDTLWATPSITAIKKKYPQAFLATLCSNVGKEVLQNNPHIDQLISLKKPFLFFLLPLFLHLKSYKFQAIFIFHASQRFIFPLCSLLNSAYFVSTKGTNKGLDALLTHSISQKALHEIARRSELLQIIGIENASPQMSFFLKKPQQSSLQLLQKNHIILHPGAADAFRCWPASFFAELGILLTKHFPYPIILTGKKKEKAMLQKISKKIPQSISVCNLTINELAFFMKKAYLVITNDTGPLQLACAMQTKVISLFVPSDPKKFGPYRVNNAIVIKKKKPCLICIERKCKNPFCFLQIKPKEVLEACKKLL